MITKKMITLNPGVSGVVTFAVTPTEAKTYQVSVNGLSGSFIANTALGFYMEPLIDFWIDHMITLSLYYHWVKAGFTVTNNGSIRETRNITIWKSYPPEDVGTTSIIPVTLNPGESIVWQPGNYTAYQMAYIANLWFTADGDWAENNHADGHIDSNGNVDIGNLVEEKHTEW